MAVPTAPKKKSSVNPCIAKGRAGGSRSGGVVYKIKGHVVRINGCECGQAFLDLSRKSEASRRYAYAPAGSAHPGALLTAQGPQAQFPPQSLEIVPCQERFRKEDSPATQFHVRAMGSLTTFRGCQSLEEDLLAQALVRHRPPKEEIMGWREPPDKDEQRGEYDAWDDADSLESWKYTQSLTQATENDDLDEDQDGEDKEEDQDGEDKEEEVIVPRQKEAWVTLLYKRSKEFKLTYRQRSAFELVYPKSGPGLTHAQAAKKLRISPHSLKDRIEGIKKKVEDRFPGITQKEKEIPGLWKAPDRQLDGFYVRSRAKHVAPLYRVNPKTGQKALMRPRKAEDKLLKTPQARISEARRKYSLHVYYPAHNGSWCSWVPVIEGKFSRGSGGFDPAMVKVRLANIRPDIRPNKPTESKLDSEQFRPGLTPDLGLLEVDPASLLATSTSTQLD